MKKALFIIYTGVALLATATASGQMQTPKNFQALQAGYWQQTIQLLPNLDKRVAKPEFRCMSKSSIPGFMSSEQAKQCKMQVVEDSLRIWRVQSFCPNSLQTTFKLEMISPLQAAIEINSISPKGRSTASGQLKFIGACPPSAIPQTVDPARLGKLSEEQCRLVGIQYEAMAPERAAVTCSKHEAKLRQVCLGRAAKSYKNLSAVLKSDACK